MQRLASLNRSLLDRVRAVQSVAELRDIVLQHAADLNYIVVAEACARLPYLLPEGSAAAALSAEVGGGQASISASPDAGTGSSASARDGKGRDGRAQAGAEAPSLPTATPEQQLPAACAELVPVLADLVVRNQAALQPFHLVQCALGLAHAGHRDSAFWRQLLKTSSRRMLSFRAAGIAALRWAVAGSRGRGWGGTGTQAWMEVDRLPGRQLG